MGFLQKVNIMIKKTLLFSLVFLLMMSFSVLISEDKIFSANGFSGRKNSERPLSESEKKDNLVVLEGVVFKVKKLKGTLSEYSCFMIKDQEKEFIIFNNKKKSRGFDFFLGKRVRVSAIEITGYVGWRRIKHKGFMILDIFTLEMDHK